ncbi:right-handed parallel beta-helix repeat-containing protein [Bacillus cereus]|uniref:right-handed parallel beta-helix repeat-containing protein n=1 Tax=Bacillus cereus TaxID=1396 RepID=UPI00027AB814|nr:right-handed parallel beta-helix repeat-containing protein [Bacillus cereus]EJS63489.1 parallel beta-helix [Bacillus cereus BAG2X1-3]
MLNLRRWKEVLMSRKLRNDYNDNMTDIENVFKGIGHNFEDMYSRIDNIVSNAGDSNTEIVDSRQTTYGMIHPTLRKRLDNIEAAMGIASVQWFGVNGDGEPINMESLNKAILYAVSNNLKLFFPPGVYKFTGIDFIEVNVDIINMTLRKDNKIKFVIEGVPGQTIFDFTTRDGFATEKGLFRITGSISNPFLLQEDFSVSTSMFKTPSGLEVEENDLLLISSDNNTLWPGDTTPPYIGQLSEVFDFDGTNIHLMEKAYSNYLVSEKAKVYKVNPVKGVYIQGIKFIGQGHRIGANADVGINMTYCRDITIRDCEFDGIDQQQITFNGCYNFLVDNCRFRHSRHETETNPPSVQYQVRAASGSAYGIISNCFGSYGRHMVHTGHLAGSRGINRFITAVNCIARRTWHAGFSSHNSDEHIKFVNCESINCRYGFNPRERNISLINVTSRDCEVGILFTKRPQRIRVEKADIINCVDAVQMLDSGLDSGFRTERISLKSLYIASCQKGITLQNTSATDIIKGLEISNCTINDIKGTGTESAIRLIGKWRGQIMDSTILRVSNRAIVLESGCNGVIVKNNTIDEAKFGVVEVDSSVDNNVIRDNTFFSVTTPIQKRGLNSIDTGNVVMT